MHMLDNGIYEISKQSHLLFLSGWIIIQLHSSGYVFSKCMHTYTEYLVLYLTRPIIQ